jgi:hypothetical protein
VYLLMPSVVHCALVDPLSCMSICNGRPCGGSRGLELGLAAMLLSWWRCGDESTITLVISPLAVCCTLHLVLTFVIIQLLVWCGCDLTDCLK